jgi:3-dehydroquinate dehydratase-2
LLGRREPHLYGTQTLAELERRMRDGAAELGCELEFRQSNSEAEIVGWLQEAPAAFGAVIMNPGAFAHYSYAIRDAVQAAEVRLIEVHITNVHAREEFRRNSVIAPVAAGTIIGFGLLSYDLALVAAAQLAS